MRCVSAYWLLEVKNIRLLLAVMMFIVRKVLYDNREINLFMCQSLSRAVGKKFESMLLQLLLVIKLQYFPQRWIKIFRMSTHAEVFHDLCCI